MSTDTVDDLHHAEDMASSAIDALERMVAAFTPPDGEWVRDAELQALTHGRRVITWWVNYCRPTCGWRDNDSDLPPDERCESGGPDDCGCPCGHHIKTGEGPA